MVYDPNEIETKYCDQNDTSRKYTMVYDHAEGTKNVVFRKYYQASSTLVRSIVDRIHHLLSGNIEVKNGQE